MLHYYPRNVSSINMPIFRRKNCIHTASVIVALCKRLHSTPVESGLSPLSTGVQEQIWKRVRRLISFKSKRQLVYRCLWRNFSSTCVRRESLHGRHNRISEFRWIEVCGLNVVQLVFLFQFSVSTTFY